MRWVDGIKNQKNQGRRRRINQGIRRINQGRRRRRNQGRRRKGIRITHGKILIERCDINEKYKKISYFFCKKLLKI